MTGRIENSNLLIGEHENQVLDDGISTDDMEANLHKHMADCKKNPDHSKFIPIESFRLEQLPESHRDSDLYELIKAIADLTVRLSVTFTSQKRPDFWPNTKDKYPLSELRGSKRIRTATGMVREVRKLEYAEELFQYKEKKPNTCPCDNCNGSEQPSKVWWEIVVLTAVHVVFDKIEASHTTLRLFFDSEASNSVIRIDNVDLQDDDVNIEEDKCRLTCVTCDKNVGDKLENAHKVFNNGLGKLRGKNYESRDIHKLNFIVSHPHGCSKQVSIGKWIGEKTVGEKKVFTYDTHTCPGSSGAYVHCVGYRGVYTERVHNGHIIGSIFNYSGCGRVV